MILLHKHTSPIDAVLEKCQHTDVDMHVCVCIYRICLCFVNVWSIFVVYRFLLQPIHHRQHTLTSNSNNFPQIFLWYPLGIQWCQYGMKINLQRLELSLIHHRQSITASVGSPLFLCSVEMILLWILCLVGTFRQRQLTCESWLLQSFVFRNT